ncbi:MAG TPA: hypothetical protein DEP35_20170 [Deltaproteobacteria bacterium]|nr:hypothetical protein [Deltaproteobacteria bacterium]
MVPFIEAGAGILGTDLDLRGQSDGFNFSVQGGTDLHYFVLPRLAVTAEARLHHISNAGLRVPNNGINDCLFLVGASFFLRSEVHRCRSHRKWIALVCERTRTKADSPGGLA